MASGSKNINLGFYTTAEQSDSVKRVADERGVKTSEILREAVNAYLDSVRSYEGTSDAAATFVIGLNKEQLQFLEGCSRFLKTSQTELVRAGILVGGFSGSLLKYLKGDPEFKPFEVVAKQLIPEPLNTLIDELGDALFDNENKEPSEAAERLLTGTPLLAWAQDPTVQSYYTKAAFETGAEELERAVRQISTVIEKKEVKSVISKAEGDDAEASLYVIQRELGRVIILRSFVLPMVQSLLGMNSYLVTVHDALETFSGIQIKLRDDLKTMLSRVGFQMVARNGANTDEVVGGEGRNTDVGEPTGGS